MKVFISWSGALSHEVALVFREWLPSVVQAVEAYVSSQDIDKGARWSNDISRELEASSYGILCVTRENISAPWLNFEAGALSRSVDKGRVCPVLFGVKRAELKGPVLQFQSTIYDEADVRKLVHSMNQACEPQPMEEARLDRIFDVWWPKLTGLLDGLLCKIPEDAKPDSARDPALPPHWRVKYWKRYLSLFETSRRHCTRQKPYFRRPISRSFFLTPLERWRLGSG